MKKLVLIIAGIVLTAGLISCTPEQLVQRSQEQSCCGDEGTLPPPPPPPPPGGD